jgi:hypothetical protein
MRESFCVFALLLAGCAEHPQTQLPRPPAHPIIEGNIKSVSSADIRFVLQLMREDMIRYRGSKFPVYTVRVLDRDHIEICYWPEGEETWASAERVKGKWKLSDKEKVKLYET